MPDGVEIHQAILTEELSCIAHGWNKINPVDVGENILVLGAGIIGLLWTCMTHLHGLRKTVTISESHERRRATVRQLGKSCTLYELCYSQNKVKVKLICQQSYRFGLRCENSN